MDGPTSSSGFPSVGFIAPSACQDSGAAAAAAAVTTEFRPTIQTKHTSLAESCQTNKQKSVSLTVNLNFRGKPIKKSLKLERKDEK